MTIPHPAQNAVGASIRINDAHPQWEMETINPWCESCGQPHVMLTDNASMFTVGGSLPVVTDWATNLVSYLLTHGVFDTNNGTINGQESPTTTEGTDSGEQAD